MHHRADSSDMPTALPCVLHGITGHTGNAVAHGLADSNECTLVAGVSPSAPSSTHHLPDGVEAYASLDQVPAETVDVLIDFSIAETVPAVITWGLDNAKHVIIGTTGFDTAILDEFGARFAAIDRGLLYAPNFALGAILMMRFATEMSRYFPDVAIVETHRAAKQDAPSGTARRTAEMIAEARSISSGAEDGASAQPALGELVDGVPVHSLRLPGAVAHQTVTGGAPGELLHITHDAIDRSCYANGVARAVHAIGDHPGLTIGLEDLL